MGRFTKISQNAFNEMQMNAGIILSTFDPTGSRQVQDADIICTTTGGINVVCEPTFSDLGEDVDNCPNNTKELKHLDGWNCSMAFKSISLSPEAIRLALGCADVDGSNTGKILLRTDLEQTDFSDLWWVGDLTDGGYVAVCLKNALSTAGFNLQTTKNGKGQTSMTLTGHVSINDISEVPMQFYSVAEGNVVYPEINLNKHAIELIVNDTEQLTAVRIPTNASVTWASGSTTIATVSGGLVTANAAGDTIITAQIAVNGVEYTDTCTVVVRAS